MKDFMLSCDWGTSTFRLCLVHTGNGQLSGQIVTDKGIAATYNNWKAGFEQHGMSQRKYFLSQLQEAIALLSEKCAISLKALPVIVSGMACSSIGIKELPYAPVPFLVDGSDAVVQLLAESNVLCNQVWLVSGISNTKDVMRGEETQMIGLAKSYKNLASERGAVWVFPGTHSKHLLVQQERIVDFRTYMTGDLFSLLRHHSILKESVSEKVNDPVLTTDDRNAFQQGVQQSGTSDLLHNLFSVRINQLFQYVRKEQNFFYLSGLLIGSELINLLSKDIRCRVLCSGGRLSHLYQLAFKALGLWDQTIILPPELVDRAVVDGQIEIFKKQLIEIIKK